MVELLSRFSSLELIALVSILGGLIFVTFAVLVDYLLKMRKAEIASKLKTDMLDRGMSADEIRIVLEAGNRSPTQPFCK